MNTNFEMNVENAIEIIKQNLSTIQGYSETSVLKPMNGVQFLEKICTLDGINYWLDRERLIRLFKHSFAEDGYPIEIKVNNFKIVEIVYDVKTHSYNFNGSVSLSTVYDKTFKDTIHTIIYLFAIARVSIINPYIEL